MIRFLIENECKNCKDFIKKIFRIFSNVQRLQENLQQILSNILTKDTNRIKIFLFLKITKLQIN